MAAEAPVEMKTETTAEAEAEVKAEAERKAAAKVSPGSDCKALGSDL